MIFDIPENEPMSRETISEDDHTYHADDHMEIADYT